MILCVRIIYLDYPTSSDRLRSQSQKAVLPININYLDRVFSFYTIGIPDVVLFYK